MDDDEFLQRFATGELTGFSHEDHLRVVYLRTRVAGGPAAIEFARRGLRAIAAAQGVPQKYHDTMTVAWATVVAHQATSEPGRDFADFLAANPQLLRRDLLDEHYTRETLFSAHARAGFVEPDVAPLPTVEPAAQAATPGGGPPCPVFEHAERCWWFRQSN